MSRENVATVRAVYKRWSSGDFRAIRDVIDPEFVLVMRPEFPDAGLYRGVERLAEYTRGFLEPWTRIVIEAEEITDAGDRVVAAVHQHGVGAESGIPVELRYWQVWSFRDRKVIRLENFRERSDALEAAGLGRSDRGDPPQPKGGQTPFI